MSEIWPSRFPRIPDEDWTRQPLGELARKYDTVEQHGWYSNLEPSIDQLVGALRAGDVLLDYSGGTGILADRLLKHLGTRRCGILIVDSSPKFLRLALEKLGGDERIAFRLIRYLKNERRLELLGEVIEASLLERGVAAVASTNAIHLYYDLGDTLRSWFEALRPGGETFIQSGNIANPETREDEWIIDETVHAIHEAAMTVAREDERYARYRAVLDDPERLAAYDKLRKKFFLPVRPLSYYLEALEAAGFKELEHSSVRIAARVGDWFDFLGAYHEGVLGWLGGSRRIEGKEPTAEAVEHRLRLIREAMDRVFAGGDGTFGCRWTYIRGRT